MTIVFLLDGYAYSGFLAQTRIAQTLGAAPNQLITVPYNNWLPTDANVSAAVTTLDSSTYLNNPSYAGIPKVILGISMGAEVASRHAREKAPTSPIPTTDLSYVLLADPENEYTGLIKFALYGGLGVPDNVRYPVTYFTRHYDGVSDFPNGVLNPTAVLNAAIGTVIIHLNYFSVGLNDPSNHVYTKPGTLKTFIWSPTYPLPLVQTNYPFFQDWWDELLRPIVNSAYNWPANTPETNVALRDIVMRMRRQTQIRLGDVPVISA